MLHKGKLYKKLAKLALVWVFVLAWFAPVPAYAASYTVTEESDWYFEIEQDATDVVIYGNSNQSCEEGTIDPMLWLYNLSGTLVAVNDDGNHNETDQCVSAMLTATLDAGVYRLRAGYFPGRNGVGYDGGEYSLSTGLTLANNFSTYNGVRFSFNANYIEQTIDVSAYAGEIDYIIVTPLVKRFYDVNDYVRTQYAAYDSAGNLVQGNITASAPTSWVEVGSGWFQASVSTGVQDSTNWDTVKIRIWAKDGEGWGGNYGTQVKEVLFKAKLDGSTEWTDLTNLLTNPQFNSINSNSAPNGWSSNASWDTCRGLNSSTLCGFVQNTWTWATPATTTTTPTTTSTTSLPPTTTTIPPTTTTTTTTLPPTTTTTTEPPFIGPPMSLTVVDDGEQIILDWDEPNVGNVQPERYAVSWRFPTEGGWAVSSQTTDAVISYDQIVSTGGFGADYVFSVRSDNDTEGMYSGWSNEVTLTVEGPPPTTTTTTVPPTTTTTIPPTTTTTLPPTTTTTTTTAPPTTTTSTTIPVTTTTTLPPTTTEVPPSTTTTTTVPPTTTTVPPTTTTVVPTTDTSTPSSVRPLPTTVVPTTLPPEPAPAPEPEPAPVPVPVPAPAPAPEPVPEPEVVTVNGEEVDIEEFFEEFAIAEEDEELALDLNSLGIDIAGVELSEIDDAEEKVVEELDAIDEQLAEDFLDVVDGEVTVEEVTALVSEANFDEISDDGKKILVTALNDAGGEVKEEFEDSVNIFEDDAYNEYVADGSTVDTETRRTVVAATAAATVVAAAASSGPSGSGGGGSGGGGGGSGDSGGDRKSSRRKTR